MSGNRIDVEGLNQFVKGIKAVDRELAKDMRRGLNQAIDLVVDVARADVPRRSGRAAKSLRSASTQTAARIVAGGQRAPYYPWLDFGGRVGRGRSVQRKFYSDGRYIFPALARTRPDVERLVMAAIAATGAAEGIEVSHDGQ